ncbi:unnamed protein product [Linum trigynum]|uniref:Uncharacterized protein n=1 Tax=Linum trigynum TaxID=586398 RepID=A0AAV2GKU5_9ROSI
MASETETVATRVKAVDGGNVQARLVGRDFKSTCFIASLPSPEPTSSAFVLIDLSETNRQERGPLGSADRRDIVGENNKRNTLFSAVTKHQGSLLIETLTTAKENEEE